MSTYGGAFNGGPLQPIQVNNNSVNKNTGSMSNQNNFTQRGYQQQPQQQQPFLRVAPMQRRSMVDHQPNRRRPYGMYGGNDHGDMSQSHL